jgi:hypothetical protein
MSRGANDISGPLYFRQASHRLLTVEMRNKIPHRRDMGRERCIGWVFMRSNTQRSQIASVWIVTPFGGVYVLTILGAGVDPPG